LACTVFTLFYIGELNLLHTLKCIHVEGEDFTYSDLKEVTVQGDATRGESLASACIGCHSIEVKGMPAPMDAVTSAQTYGVNPPDLSLAGKLLDEKFFTHFLLNPAEVTKSNTFQCLLVQEVSKMQQTL